MARRPPKTRRADGRKRVEVLIPHDGNPASDSDYNVMLRAARADGRNLGPWLLLAGRELAIRQEARRRRMIP